MDGKYLQRCAELGLRGAGAVSPNPMVGAVLVARNRIIGEGFHQKYGGPHAEVRTFSSVKKADLPLLPEATLYVSLEPCCIFGKTPPCTDLILRFKIPRVVIAAVDYTSGVAGQGIQILRDKGVNVSLLPHSAASISSIRNTFVQQERPYIVLKWAESQDGFFAQAGKQVWLSNRYSKRLVHRWRSELDAIMIGTQTARVDNPKLTNRLYYGKSPIRVVFDRRQTLSQKIHLFTDTSAPTIVFSTHKASIDLPHVTVIQIPEDATLQGHILPALYARSISSLLVEGGEKLLRTFLDENLWDEIRLIKTSVRLKSGLPSPKPAGRVEESLCLGRDQIFRIVPS